MPAEYSRDPEMRILAEQVTREIVRYGPQTKFSDVVGLESPKRLLQEINLLPELFPNAFKMGNPLISSINKNSIFRYKDRW